MSDNARDNLLAAVSFNDAANAGSTPEELVEAHRLAVIAERDAQIITWLEKKATEEGTSNKDSRVRATAIYRMADKLSRGAVRPPLSSDAIRNKLRAEGLAEAADIADQMTGSRHIVQELRLRSREVADQ